MQDETTNGQGNIQQEEFGIDQNTTSKGFVGMSGGLNKAYLVSVSSDEIGKTDKYSVLNFKFKDLENIKEFTHTEFIPKGQATTKLTELEDYNNKKINFNKRIKHIFETFAKFPEKGLGGGKNWKENFDMIANQFNTLNEGKPVYQYVKEDGKIHSIPVWLKNTYQTQGKGKGNLQFPKLPNFIEKITPDSLSNPKTLVIDKKYDVIIQPDKDATNSSPGVMGGPISSNSSADDFAF